MYRFWLRTRRGKFGEYYVRRGKIVYREGRKVNGSVFWNLRGSGGEGRSMECTLGTSLG